MWKQALTGLAVAAGLVGGAATLAQDPGQPEPPALAGQPAAEADPMQAVEAFIERGRQEADGAIQALTQERDALRDRLQKVEAALGRWQAVADALEKSQAAPAAVEPEPAEAPAAGPADEPGQLEAPPEEPPGPEAPPTVEPPAAPGEETP